MEYVEVLGGSSKGKGQEKVGMRNESYTREE